MNGVIHRGAHRYFEKKLSVLGLHRGMIHILKQLFQKDRVSQQELSSGILVDKANVTRVLKRMEALKLIERQKAPSDGRLKIICLTEKAKLLEAPLQDVLACWSSILTEGMDEAEKETLHNLLVKCISNVQKSCVNL